VTENQGKFAIVTGKVGYEAMMNGDGDVVAGWKNKIMSAVSLITPSDMLAEKHRKEAAPGSANK
jgi:hypothetical protein